VSHSRRGARFNVERSFREAKCLLLSWTLDVQRSTFQRMPGQTHQVADPPPSALLAYDGACEFCKLWIARWREKTGPAVDYVTFQEIAARFPEIPLEDFEQAIKLIEPDGRVFSGAEAVYRSLGCGRRSLARWSYDHLPGFASLSDAFYAFVAGHRGLAGAVTKLLWGKDVRRPTYFYARRWFLRMLGAIYLFAFLSLWLQVDGLIGDKGVSPVSQFLGAVHTQLGGQSYIALPTLCWLNSSNAFVHFLCGGGALLSVLLIVGIAPILCLVLLFVCYLSLTVAGQDFLSFQWDILLLETGFLAIFLAPFRWRLRRDDNAPLSRPALFLLHFLLFKLMLMSGVVKLSSGDVSWWNLTALDYHYWTQPLPTVLGWWMDKAPEWFKHFSTAFVLVVEIAGAFLIWMPRRLRLIGCGAIVLLQILIALTGNYAFFNLLAIALCLLLIDDAVWPRSRPTAAESIAGWRWPIWVPALLILVTMPVNAMLLVSAFKPEAKWQWTMEVMYGVLEPFRLVNGYGLFRVMTKERPEIVIEGSADGTTWQAYEFRWKPGALERPPKFVEPHQPRLDWQMWFAALGDLRQNRWLVGLVTRLLENTPEVVRLLGNNPFPEKPPRFIRAEVYRYRFSTLAEHRATGVWWQRRDRRGYLPSVSLRGP
jgi:predicted DCC family thiol-disulfide oxidoreductase YuxK